MFEIKCHHFTFFTVFFYKKNWMVFLPVSFYSVLPCIRASFLAFVGESLQKRFKGKRIWTREWRKVVRREREGRNPLYIVLPFGAIKIPRLLSNACQATDVFHYLPGYDLRRNISFAFSPRLYFMIVIGIPQWINRWEKYLVVASRFIYTFSGCELSCATSTRFGARLRLYWKPTF